MIRAIPARILRQVLLVIILGVIERWRLADLGGDSAEPRLVQRRLEGAPRLFRRFQLCMVYGQDRRAVLRATVVTLAHTLGRVVRLPEYAQQLFVTDALGIENHLDGFGMTGGSAAHLFVGWVRHVATGISDRRGIDARQLPEGLFRAPEAAHGKQGALEPVGIRSLEAVTVYKMRLGNLHRQTLVLLS